VPHPHTPCAWAFAAAGSRKGEGSRAPGGSKGSDEQGQDPRAPEQQGTTAQRAHPQMAPSSGGRRGCETDRMRRVGDRRVSASALAKLIFYLGRKGLVEGGWAALCHHAVRCKLCTGSAAACLPSPSPPRPHPAPHVGQHGENDR